MKKMFALAFGSMLAINLVAADPAVSDADQKWLTAVEKMIANGHNQISTPVETRALLLKDWAKKKRLFRPNQQDGKRVPGRVDQERGEELTRVPRGRVIYFAGAE